MNDDTNFYQILGIPVGSKDIAIKRAYRSKVFIYHPDTRDKNLSEEKNKEYDLKLARVQEAYEVLSNAEMKEAYDSIVAVLEEQKNTIIDDSSGGVGQGVWNIPAGQTMTYWPYSSGSVSSSAPMSSGSAYSTSFYVPAIKQRFSIRVDDVVSLGLTGLSIGDVVHISYFANSTFPALGTKIPSGTILDIPCRVLAAHYGITVGGVAYGDFSVEEI